VPTYDYVCEACGHEFEAFHAMSAPPLRTCPECGKRKLVRRIGAGAGLIFKGSGFYATDYKSTPRGEASKTQKDGEEKAGESKKGEPGKGTASKSDAGTEPKPAKGEGRRPPKSGPRE
jgi:putative FmdB family regulatory protein